MTDLALYRTMRDDDGLHIIPRSPARGTEKRTQTESQIPYSSTTSLSPPAILLRDAIGGDERAKNTLYELSNGYVEGIAKKQNWKLKRSLGHISRIPLEELINNKVKRQRERADDIGVNLYAYQKNWEPKINMVEIWLKGWLLNT